MLELDQGLAPTAQPRASSRFVDAMSTVVHHAADLFVLVDAEGILLYANPAASRTFGVALEDAIGTNAGSYLHPDDLEHVTEHFERLLATPGESLTDTVRFVSTSDEVRILELVYTNCLNDPEVAGVIVNGRDITERRELEAELVQQTLHDPLTGLANRTLFVDRAERLMALARRDQLDVSVLFVDLDDFKTVNDAMGHQAGDELLRSVAGRLAATIRQDDLLGRFGGDEFVILVHPRSAEESGELLAHRLGDVLRRPCEIEGRSLTVTASVGIATGRDQTVEELVRDADVAMHQAKAAGKRRVVAFAPQMGASANDRLQLVIDLQHALEHDEFTVHYQPVVDLATRSITGVEALVRWDHPVRGRLAPLEFIPCAEENGMIVELGRQVLTEACRRGRSWGLDTRGLTLAVNLSARQLASPGLVEDVSRILTETAFAPAALVLEITETVLVQDAQAAVSRLRALKALGVRLAIDDFGTGFSSLSYLRQLPVDILKIDRSFVSDLHDSSESAAIVRSLIDLGHTLDLELIAEGVEVEAQSDALLAQHCTLAQGFLFARPMDASSLAAVLDRGLAPPAP